MDPVILRTSPPPLDWGVSVNPDALESLADRWAGDRFELPQFDYPGTPTARDESWWFDYVTLSVSVLACLWAPAGHQTWHTESAGEWLDDAPGIFAVFTKRLGNDGIDLSCSASVEPTGSVAECTGSTTPIKKRPVPIMNCRQDKLTICACSTCLTNSSSSTPYPR